MWQDDNDDSVYYSLIQSFDEEGKETEVIAYGQADTVEHAKRIVDGERESLR